MENNNINKFKLNDPDYVPTTTHGICEAGSNLPDDIKFPSEFHCEAGERTKLDWGKDIGTQFDEETKKDLDKKWKELQKDFGKINTPQQPSGGYIQDGWRCPVCGTVYAPWVRQCSNCGPANPTKIVYKSNTSPLDFNTYPDATNTPYPISEPSTKEPIGEEKPSTCDPIQRHPSSVCGSLLNS